MNELTDPTMIDNLDWQHDGEQSASCTEDEWSLEVYHAPAGWVWSGHFQREGVQVDTDRLTGTVAAENLHEAKRAALVAFTNTLETLLVQATMGREE